VQSPGLQRSVDIPLYSDAPVLVGSRTEATNVATHGRFSRPYEQRLDEARFAACAGVRVSVVLLRVDLQDEGAEPVEVARDQPPELASDQGLESPERSARPRSDRLRQLRGAINAREPVLLLKPHRARDPAASESRRRRPDQHLVGRSDAKQADPGRHHEPRTSIGRARGRSRRCDRASSPPGKVRLKIAQHREHLLGWPINANTEAQLDHVRRSLTSSITTRAIDAAEIRSPRSVPRPASGARARGHDYACHRALHSGDRSFAATLGLPSPISDTVAPIRRCAGASSRGRSPRSENEGR